MSKFARLTWPAGILGAGLLLLPFSIAGPVPIWRTFFAWVAFVPLLSVLLWRGNRTRPSQWLRGLLAGYLMGVLWYMGNCYWVYPTMLHYGGLSPVVSFLILLGFSLVLGLYFAAFGLAIAFMSKSSRGPLPALIAAPFFWAAIEFASSRITQVPWDLLGYSQISNFWLTSLAPFTGVYGLSFVLMAVNAAIAYGVVLPQIRQKALGIGAAVLAVVVISIGILEAPPAQPTQATAILVQPNISVDADNSWPGVEYQLHVDRLIALSSHRCTAYFSGFPEQHRQVVPNCPSAPPPGLVAWPESPAPFRDKDPRFRAALRAVAREDNAPVVSGNIGVDSNKGRVSRYNSALFVDASGRVLGRYDKIHLVPWGEYVPFKKFFSFAGNLTQEAGDLTHGWRYVVFRTGGRSFGVFICYEEIFGNEVRIFAKKGAQVLVNISDDGWYGKTSAPWQTLNMARMRAVENRRWLLRDTNNGLTTVIDPYGRLTASISRHDLNVLAAPYGYRSDLTFYTRHGDIFAKLCGIISLLILLEAVRFTVRDRRSQAHQLSQVS